MEVPATIADWEAVFAKAKEEGFKKPFTGSGSFNTGNGQHTFNTAFDVGQDYYLENGKVVTSGGRVLGVTATADTLEDAIENAYKAVEKVHFDNAFYRKDIGKKALAIKANK